MIVEVLKHAVVLQRIRHFLKLSFYELMYCQEKGTCMTAVLLPVEMEEERLHAEMMQELQMENQMEQLVVAADCYRHCNPSVEGDMELGIHRHLGLCEQEKVRQERQEEGSHCSLGPQLPRLDKARVAH